MKDAFDLINRQQAEIERLQKNEIKDIDKIMAIVNSQYARIKRLKGYNKDLQDEMHKAQSEAIKEFANEFEYEILHKEFWNDHPHTSQVWLNGYEQCMRDMRVMLKDKLKEMMGEDK
jgi:antirestriction protein